MGIAESRSRAVRHGEPRLRLSLVGSIAQSSERRITPDLVSLTPIGKTEPVGSFVRNVSLYAEQGGSSARRTEHMTGGPIHHEELQSVHAETGETQKVTIDTQERSSEHHDTIQSGSIIDDDSFVQIPWPRHLAKGALAVGGLALATAVAIAFLPEAAAAVPLVAIGSKLLVGASALTALSASVFPHLIDFLTQNHYVAQDIIAGDTQNYSANTHDVIAGSANTNGQVSDPNGPTNLGWTLFAASQGVVWGPTMTAGTNYKYHKMYDIKYSLGNPTVGAIFSEASSAGTSAPSLLSSGETDL